MKQPNKFYRFLKKLPAKLWILLAAVVVFAFLSNDFSLVDIQKTAVILAAGLDRKEDGYRMTAQIAVPKGTDRTTGGTSSVNFTADGKTIADCVADIYCKTGWVPKFVFCNLLLIGEEAATKNVFDALDYFLRNEFMPDSSFIAVCAGTAEELLSSESAIDDTSSQAITRLFSDATVKAGKAMQMTLKEFAIGYYGPSKSGYMPYVMPHQQEGAEGGTGQSGKEQPKKQKIYCAERTALFHEGRMTGLLPSDLTFTFSLIKSNVFSGYLLTQEKGKNVSLTVLKDEGKVTLNAKANPQAEVTLKLTVRLYNRAAPSEIDDVTKNAVSQELLDTTGDLLKQNIAALWEIAQASKCDLFDLSRMLYRVSPAKFMEYEGKMLSIPISYKLNLYTAK